MSPNDDARLIPHERRWTHATPSASVRTNTILLLAKLCRNSDRDLDDVVALALGPGLDVDVLQQRYRDELRSTLGRADRDDLTLRPWIEMIEGLRVAQ
jgi:hypothetical protein